MIAAGEYRPRPPEAAYSAPPDPLAGFRGPLRGRGGGKDNRIRGGKGERGRQEGEGEESWNRAADWPRPALQPSCWECIDHV